MVQMYAIASTVNALETPVHVHVIVWACVACVYSTFLLYISLAFRLYKYSTCTCRSFYIAFLCIIIHIINELLIKINVSTTTHHTQETPTGYFAYRNKFDQLITRCTMSNILNEEVVFVHLLDPSVPLSYNQALKITDGQWILRPWPVSIGHVCVSSCPFSTKKVGYKF